MYIRDKCLIVESDNFADIATAQLPKEQLEDIEVFTPHTPYFESMDMLLRFPNLRQLVFDKCELIDFSAIHKISSTEKLAFFECNFGSPLRLPGPFPRLTSLSIGYPTEATAALIADVTKFVTLEELNLFLSNDVASAELETLADLTRLKSLGLARSAQMPLDFIASFKALEQLHLDGVGASALDSSLTSILALPNLKTFSIQGAQLDLGMDLRDLGKLDYFSITPHTDNNLEVLITWESYQNQR